MSSPTMRERYEGAGETNTEQGTQVSVVDSIQGEADGLANSFKRLQTARGESVSSEQEVTRRRATLADAERTALTAAGSVEEAVGGFRERCDDVINSIKRMRDEVAPLA